MKHLLFILSLFVCVQSVSAKALTYPAVPAEAGAELSCRTETPGHFTLPIGLPFSLSGNRDTNTSGGRKDTSSGKVIKGQVPSKKKVYQLSIGDDNDATTWRQTEEAFRQAQDMNADYILVHVGDDNAFNAVNKIRNRLYHYKTPVLLYVENKNRTGNSIIPLSKDTLAILKNVLGRNHEKSPVKNPGPGKPEMKENEPYVTAQPLMWTNGKKCVRNINEETYFNQGPGPQVQVTEELQQAGLDNFDLIDYKPTALGRLIDLLVSPLSIFLLTFLLTAGIYFQFRSIGNGFPLFISVCSTLLLFASGRFEGLTEGWELLLFLAGLILLSCNIYLSKKNSLLFPGVLLILAGLTYAVLDPDTSLASWAGLQKLLLNAGAVLLALACCLRTERHLFARYALRQQENQASTRFPYIQRIPDLS
jgi:membrane-bound serine protease (ClpP class)